MSVAIGCNIVHPLCDKAEMYTRQVYLERISAYKRYGFQHVEFSHVTAINEADAEAIRAHAGRVGIVPWSIHSEHLNAGEPQAVKDYFAVQTHCAEVARSLGTTAYVCHIPNVPPYAKDMRRDADILRRLADITDAHGLKLAIETGPPTDYVVELADRIDRRSVGINLDTGHVFLIREDPAAAARKIGGRLITTHLQDNFGKNDDHQAPGMGLIDWREVLQALKDIRYAGPLMVELTGCKANRTAEELRDFSLEKEIVFTLGYLRFLAAGIAQENE